MKNFTYIFYIFLLVTGNNLFAQQEKGIVGSTNWLNNWTEFNPAREDYGEPTQILTGNITEDTKLYKRDIYLLLGSVFVTNNATLTIEPGTVIIGDNESKGSLTITTGSSIIAEGYETDPIVFTSNSGVKRPGDWGGLIILGQAPNNKFGNGSLAAYYDELTSANFANTNYGGDSINSNSGILKYVRIEYAGRRSKKVGYTNGLFLAGVGNQTVLENIMVSFSGGDSFEVLGGDIKLEKAVSYKSNGNDFSFNLGSQCKLNNSLAVRSPYSSNNEASRCMQVLSYDKIEGIDFSKKGTTVLAKNVTLLNDSMDLTSDIDNGLVKECMFIGENASLNMSKSVISGFNKAVILQETISINQENLDKIKFSNMLFDNCRGNIFTEGRSNNDDLENWYGNIAFFNVYSKEDNSETFIDIRDPRKPDFRLQINKITATGK